MRDKQKDTKKIINNSLFSLFLMLCLFGISLLTIAILKQNVVLDEKKEKYKQVEEELKEYSTEEPVVTEPEVLNDFEEPANEIDDNNAEISDDKTAKNTEEAEGENASNEKEKSNPSDNMDQDNSAVDPAEQNETEDIKLFDSTAQDAAEDKPSSDSVAQDPVENEAARFGINTI